MNDDQNRLFEAIHKLMEQVWRDWDHKSRHEWRLSFGICASLIAGTGAVLNTTTQFNLLTSTIAITCALVLLHFVFNIWIHNRLIAYRSEYDRLRALIPIDLPSGTPDNKKRWFKSPSLWTQLGVTIVLSTILVYVVESKMG